MQTTTGRQRIDSHLVQAPFAIVDLTSEERRAKVLADPQQVSSSMILNLATPSRILNCKKMEQT